MTLGPFMAAMSPSTIHVSNSGDQKTFIQNFEFLFYRPIFYDSIPLVLITNSLYLGYSRESKFGIFEVSKMSFTCTVLVVAKSLWTLRPAVFGSHVLELFHISLMSVKFTPSKRGMEQST